MSQCFSLQYKLINIFSFSFFSVLDIFWSNGSSYVDNQVSFLNHYAFWTIGALTGCCKSSETSLVWAKVLNIIILQNKSFGICNIVSYGQQWSASNGLSNKECIFELANLSYEPWRFLRHWLTWCCLQEIFLYWLLHASFVFFQSDQKKHQCGKDARSCLKCVFFLRLCVH